jgi:hypothetical protein
MTRRNILGLFLTAGFVSAFALACTDSPTATDETLPVPGTPLFLLDDNFNGSGACLGEDSYDAGRVGGMQSPSDLNCTANDIEIAEAYAVAWSLDNVTFTPAEAGPITCVEGETIYVETVAHLRSNATARYDIGVWIAEDGGDAVTGECGHWNLLNTDDGVYNDDGDQCGDMRSGPDVIVELGVLELTCTPNEDNLLEVGACLGWNNNARQACPLGSDDEQGFRFGTTPETKSKCNCDPFVLDIIVLQEAHLEVVKACDPVDWDGYFDLVIDGDHIAEIRAEDEECGGTTGRQTLGAGTSVDPGADYTFAEYAGMDTDLDDFNTTWECRTVGDDLVDSGSGPGPHNIHLNPDDDIVCTFTNAVKRASLTLNKTVVNDDGGTAVAADFQAYINGEEVDWGVPETDLLPGLYTASEDVVAGYSAGDWGGDCNADGTITLNPGQNAVCSITNDDIAPTLTLYKIVDGGTAVADDFQAYIDGSPVPWATAQTLSVGSYVVSESVVADYEAGTWTGDCDPDGSITLALADEAECTITNTYVPPMDTETAWAANGNVPLQLPFNPDGGGDWATYVQYQGFEGTGKVVTMFAGQTIEVGTATFSAEAGGEVTIVIELTGGWSFAPESVVAVQDYDSAPSGNPAPGQFDHKEPATGTDHSITVPLANYYAVHAVVQ